jgi:hypothetical protein
MQATEKQAAEPTTQRHRSQSIRVSEFQRQSPLERKTDRVASPGRAIFDFARTVKAMGGLRNATGERLRPVVANWLATDAPPNVVVMPFDDVWREFCNAWMTVRWARGEDPVTDAFAEARNTGPCVSALRYTDETTRLLVTGCRILQKARGDGNSFILSARKAGRQLGVSWTFASKLLRTLQVDGLLKCTKPGVRGYGGNDSGARFLYVGD